MTGVTEANPWIDQRFLTQHHSWVLMLDPATFRNHCISHGLLNSPQINLLTARETLGSAAHNERLLAYLLSGERKSFKAFLKVVSKMGFDARHEKLAQLLQPAACLPDGGVLFMPSAVPNAVIGMMKPDIYSSARNEARDISTSLKQTAEFSSPTGFDSNDVCHSPLSESEGGIESLASAKCTIWINDKLMQELGDPRSMLLTELEDIGFDPENVVFRREKCYPGCLTEVTNQKGWKNTGPSNTLVRVIIKADLGSMDYESVRNDIIANLAELVGTMESVLVVLRQQVSSSVCLTLLMPFKVMVELYNQSVEYPGVLAGIGILEFNCLFHPISISFREQGASPERTEERTVQFLHALGPVNLSMEEEASLAQLPFHHAVMRHVRTGFPRIADLRRTMEALKEVQRGQDVLPAQGRFLRDQTNPAGGGWWYVRSTSGALARDMPNQRRLPSQRFPGTASVEYPAGGYGHRPTHYGLPRERIRTGMGRCHVEQVRSYVEIRNQNTVAVKCATSSRVVHVHAVGWPFTMLVDRRWLLDVLFYAMSGRWDRQRVQNMSALERTVRITLPLGHLLVTVLGCMATDNVR